MGAKTSKKSYNVNPAGVVTPGAPAAPGGASGSNVKTGNASLSVGQDDSTVEMTLCGQDEMTDGEMRQFELKHGEDKRLVLLVKDNGQFHAVGGKCTHYGAPLIKGSYCNGKVRCPWHGACFDVQTGDIEDCPGIDSLPSFPTKIENGQVKIQAQTSQLTSFKRVKPMVKSTSDTPVVVIVGGGAAAATCSETLRQEGFQGRILILTEESCVPYDRPKLSKAISVQIDDIWLRPPEFYHEHRIEVLTGQRVVDVDTEKEIVVTEQGENFKYDFLVAASGGNPRRLNCPGSNLNNVFYLRTPEDCQAICGASEGKNMVIIGSSFIGLELAALLVKKLNSCHVIGASEVPFERIFGREIGLRMKELHEENKVIFHCENGVDEILSNDNGSVSSVVLKNGETLDADIVVVGIGVMPSTEYLKNTEVQLDGRGFVVTDITLQTNVPNIYAAGDIVCFPLAIFDHEVANIQHWQMALKHGMHVAKAILGRPEAVHSVPFFWTVMFGKSLRFTGYAHGFDDIIIHGSLPDLKFVAYYLKDNRVVGVATMNRDPVAAKVADIFKMERILDRGTVESNLEDQW